MNLKKLISVFTTQAVEDAVFWALIVTWAVILVAMPSERRYSTFNNVPCCGKATVHAGYSRKTQLPSIPEYGPDLFKYYVDDICQGYPEVDPAVAKAIIWQESRYEPDCKSDGGYSVGLMQVSTRWHMDRASALGVEDLLDPYSNILVGVDYLNDLLKQTGKLDLALMLYNMNHKDAYRLYNSGRLSKYATSVLAKADEYREEVTCRGTSQEGCPRGRRNL